MSEIAIFRQTEQTIHQSQAFTELRLWNHVERHVARQHASGCGHRDITGGRAGRDRGLDVRVGDNREVCRNAVQHYAAGSREALPQDFGSLADSTSGLHKGDEWREPCRKSENSAAAVRLIAVRVATRSCCPIKGAVSALNQPERVIAIGTARLGAKGVKRCQIAARCNPEYRARVFVGCSVEVPIGAPS